MTENQPAVVDAAAYTVRRTIRIAAPVSRVWPAVTEPEHISRWFGRTELAGDEAGSGAGAVGTMTFEGYGSIPLRVDAVDAPHSIRYLWNNDDALGTPPESFDPATATAFTFSLEPDGEGTLLTVVETGFDRTSEPAANLESHGTGWTLELDKLVALLETGTPA